MEAWYFSAAGRRIEIGATETVDGRPWALFRHGLHASVRALDALGGLADGPVLWSVRLGGRIWEMGDSLFVASQRTYIAGGVDASEMLRAFARWCALSVAHLWDCPGVVARYLVTGDESLREAARVAARSAAGDAAWAAMIAAELDIGWPAASVMARESSHLIEDTARAAQFERMCHDLLDGNHWWEAKQ